MDISLDNLSPYSKGVKQSNTNSMPMKSMMSGGGPSQPTPPPAAMMSPLGASKAPSNFFPAPMSPTGLGSSSSSTANNNLFAASNPIKPATAPFVPFQNELNQFKSLNFDKK